VPSQFGDKHGQTK